MKRSKLSRNSAEELWNDDEGEDLSQMDEGKQQNSLCTGPGMNPMKIDLVLDILFSFCPVKTLMNCRLVCKQWKDVSLRAWRNNAILHPGKKSDGLHNVQKYLKLLQSNLPKDAFLQLKNYPFKNFVIKPSLREYLKDSALPIANIARHVILRDYKGQLVQIKEFLSKFHSLQSLELENCEWKRVPEGPIQTSNVKKLKIFRNVNQGGFGFDDWKGLMKSFQNLETLSIEYRTPKDCMPAIHDLLRCVCNIRIESGNIVMPLKELKVIQLPQTSERSASWFGDILTSLIDCQFPSERLSIHVVQNLNDFVDHQGLSALSLGIHQLLETCKDTLQYWETSFFWKTRTPLRMDALKEVILSNGLLGLITLSDIELPNLQKLVISNEESSKKWYEISNFRLTFPRGRIYESLETLEFLDNRKIPGPDVIRAFAKLMPNLVNLTIPLDKQTFVIACECFKGLKSLNALAAQCRYDELDDESLTGVSKREKSSRRRKPNITDLVHLTNVKIACETELQGNSPFTDHSVVHGFLQLPKLYSLSISFKEISDENKKKLLNHVKGNVDIQVKTKARTESYCDIEIDMTSPEI